MLFAANRIPTHPRSVVFTIDSNRRWQTTRPPYRYGRTGTINTRRLHNGRHVLTVRVTYRNRTRRTARKVIRVENPNLSRVAVPASVGVTGPPAGGVRGPSVANFNRETYLFSSSLSMSQEANRYQVLVLAGNQGALVPQLHAMNPNLKILLYQAVMETNSDDYTYMRTVTGCTSYYTDTASNPNFILHDQNGQPVHSRGSSDHYVTDVGNRAYQQTCATNAAALAKKYGFDGVFLDMVQGNLFWTLNPGTKVPEYPSTASWASAMGSALNYLGPALRAQGLLVFGNVSGAPSTTAWEQWVSQLSGVEEESWTDGKLGLAQQVPFWNSKFAELNWAQANGKYEIVHSYNRTVSANEFGLAAMMLATKGLASYSTSNSNYTSQENWFPDYTTAQSLGAPASPYRVLSDGVYERVFANGIVLVNPGAHAVPTFSLGGNAYSNSQYNSVRSIAMPATTGVILKLG